MAVKKKFRDTSSSNSVAATALKQYQYKWIVPIQKQKFGSTIIQLVNFSLVKQLWNGLRIQQLEKK